MEEKLNEINEKLNEINENLKKLIELVSKMLINSETPYRGAEDVDNWLKNIKKFDESKEQKP